MTVSVISHHFYPLSGQFHGPVGVVEKLLPALVAFVIQMNVDHRVIFGFDGFLNEFHVRLCRRPTAFFDIAFQAGAHDIVPSG